MYLSEGEKIWNSRRIWCFTKPNLIAVSIFFREIIIAFLDGLLKLEKSSRKMTPKSQRNQLGTTPNMTRDPVNIWFEL